MPIEPEHLLDLAKRLIGPAPGVPMEADLRREGYFDRVLRGAASSPGEGGVGELRVGPSIPVERRPRQQQPNENRLRQV